MKKKTNSDTNTQVKRFQCFNQGPLCTAMNEITPLKRGGIPENITVRVQVDLQNTSVSCSRYFAEVVEQHKRALVRVWVVAFSWRGQDHGQHKPQTTTCWAVSSPPPILAPPPLPASCPRICFWKIQSVKQQNSLLQCLTPGHELMEKYPAQHFFFS